MQYASVRYKERLPEAGIETSVGGAGGFYALALAEYIIGLYETEVIRQRGPWRNLEAGEFETLAPVDGFNHRWLPKPIGHGPPAELEAACQAQTHESAMAA